MNRRVRKQTRKSGGSRRPGTTTSHGKLRFWRRGIIFIVICSVLLLLAISIMQVASPRESQGASGELTRALRDVLFQVIDSHPRKEIREEFLPLVEKNGAIVFTSDMPRNVPMMVVKYTDQGRDIPVIYFGSLFLQMSLQGQWSTLVHEYVHFKELTNDNSLWVRVQDEKTAMAHFESEVRGYTAECNFREEIQYWPRIERCSVLIEKGQREFQRFLVNHLIKLANDVHIKKYQKFILSQIERDP